MNAPLALTTGETAGIGPDLPFFLTYPAWVIGQDFEEAIWTGVERVFQTDAHLAFGVI